MYLEMLQQQFKVKSSTLPKEVQHRIYRTLSWLNQSESLNDEMPLSKGQKNKKTDTMDMQFITLWIGFNAIYARKDFNDDKNRFRDFLKIMVEKEKDKLENIIWHSFSNRLNNFLDNQYLSRHFWEYHNQEDAFLSEQYWIDRFNNENRTAKQCLVNKDTERLLNIIFDRLYTLRNQIFHGGSSFQSSVNRGQIQQSVHLLRDLVPVFALVVLNNPNDSAWGHPYYPVIDD